MLSPDAAAQAGGSYTSAVLDAFSRMSLTFLGGGSASASPSASASDRDGSAAAATAAAAAGTPPPACPPSRRATPTSGQDAGASNRSTHDLTSRASSASLTSSAPRGDRSSPGGPCTRGGGSSPTSLLLSRSGSSPLAATAHGGSGLRQRRSLGGGSMWGEEGLRGV